jgi:hypothetical protein
MAGRTATTARVRFDEKCHAMPSGCVEWTGGGTTNGYGLFWTGERMQTAHRWQYEQAHGAVDSRLDVCHSCDNRRCVLLGHLFAGTRKQNMEDAASKGRMSHWPRVSGERHGMATLVVEQIDAIRALRQQGATYRSIAEPYGVSIAHVQRICTGQSWKAS